MDNEDVNNSWEASSSVLAGTVTSNHPLLIGKHHPAHNRTASGFVDDIAIWDKELNDVQIQQLFNQESPTSVEYSNFCLLYTSPSPRDRQKSRMPSSA